MRAKVHAFDAERIKYFGGQKGIERRDGWTNPYISRMNLFDMGLTRVRQRGYSARRS